MPINAKNKHNRQAGIARIVWPTAVTAVLFIVSIFVIIIPSFRSNMMDRKREMIKELTSTAWSVFQEYAEEEKKGNLTRVQAQQRAIADIRYLRYGQERKDYFWVTDMHPNMVMHPYRPELEGKDLSGELGQDPTGKNLFVEMVKVCRENGGHGFVEYMWQWKDDPSRIVPKLSYVKAFQPWGWIIGTGIYIEDVKEEISRLTSRLVTISIGITILIAFLLFYIMRESLKIERRRQKAENQLRDSEKRYRTLVETATEGTIMFLEGKYIYSNQTVRNMLDYSAEEFAALELPDIFKPGGTPLPQEKETGELTFNYFSALIDRHSVPPQYDARLKKKNGQWLDVSLTSSQISLGDEKGIVVSVRDISGHKQVEEELDQSRVRYNNLTSNLSIGVFRTTTGRRGTFIEANPAAIKILGFNNSAELFQTSIFELFYQGEERVNLFKELIDKRFVKNRLLTIRRADQSLAVLSVSLVLVEDADGEPRFCDGLVEDITERKRMEEGRENLIVELQTAQLFYNQAIKHFIKDILQCAMDMPIRKAAAIMTKNKYSAILVTGGQPQTGGQPLTGGQPETETPAPPRYLGIVTDRDLRERVVAEGISPDSPVYQVMSSPLISIPDSALIFEAMLLMQEKRVRHLAVKDHGGRIISIISNEQLMHIQRNTSAYLIKEIHEAPSVDEIVIARNRLPRLVKALIDSGANSRSVCRIITAVSDSILERLIQFAIDELGPPPAEFAFVALGSEGREEQTLLTDQDNAIIYQDIDNPDEAKTAREYFLKFGGKVCDWLDRCGYSLCKGDMMAKNPKWCQPLAKWKKYFNQWIHTANPQDLLEINVFFDFRCLYGQKEFTNQLKTYIQKLIGDTPAFLQYIARNALLYKPPIGFFGKIVVDSSGEKPSTFDIKEAIKPMVNFARIYSLKHDIIETNTQERLQRLYAQNVINRSSHDEIIKVYDYLMQIRFKHQAGALNENRNPDNLINPKTLTDIEQSLLKNTFSQINNFQKRLSYDFTGTA